MPHPIVIEAIFLLATCTRLGQEHVTVLGQRPHEPELPVEARPSPLPPAL